MMKELGGITRRVEIVPSGIYGLDRLLNGGFPRGAVVLLAGNPGTGKSTFAAKFLYEGARRFKEPGIYLNFVEPRNDFLNHMAMLGMDFESLEKDGLFHYVEALTIVDEDALISQLEEVLRLVDEVKARRIVIDSITAMLQIVRDKAKIRELLQNFFVNGLKPLGVTSILIAEHPYGARVVGYGIEEFIVDAVFILRFQIEQGKLQRILELRKARWAPIHQAELPFYMRPGVVIEISLPEEPEEVPPFDITKTYDLCKLLGSLRVNDRYLIRITAPGSEQETQAALRAICRVLSIPRGAQVLIGLSTTVNSRLVTSMLATSFIMSEPISVLVISFKSSPQAISNMARCMLDMSSKGRNTASKLRQLHVISLNPSAYTVNELNDIMHLAMEKIRPEIAIFEGLEILKAMVEERELLFNLYNMLLRNKRNGITGFYLYSLPMRSAMSELDLAAMFDMGMYLETSPGRLSDYYNEKRYSGLTLDMGVEVYHQLAHIHFNMSVDTQKLAELHCIG
ncbi:circadian clock protein KaiC [Pyrodictium delaneyi]|uniref:Circadian clock protein KaiC n=1 Tax=Pyrodictium delaneyi TaxID=1273541 RepID=A0A0P0N3Y4_9CREN|nr:circadian clock protein KaiC [Pyrodictium delaneyi]